MYPPIHPIIFEAGTFKLYWYSLLMALSIIAGTYVASRYCTRKGLDSNIPWYALIWTLVPALIGARLYYILFQIQRGPTGSGRFTRFPLEVLQIWNGGIHFYGVLLAGICILLLFIFVRKRREWSLFDGAALGLLLGGAIGRLGNFINQEVYGPPTTLPWGLAIDSNHRIKPYNDLTKYPETLRFQPLFLYGLFWDGLGFAFLFWLSQRAEKWLRVGDLFWLYLIWTALGRFLLEFWRLDSWFVRNSPFSVTHAVSMLLIIAGIAGLAWRHRPGTHKQQLALEGAAAQPIPTPTPPQETTGADTPPPPAVDNIDKSEAPVETKTETISETTTISPETTQETETANTETLSEAPPKPTKSSRETLQESVQETIEEAPAQTNDETDGDTDKRKVLP